MTTMPIEVKAVKEKHRNEFIDYLKGLLILFVTYGHTIQFIGYDNDSFWYDPIFKFIYIFHMPLFMGVSGFLSYSSIQKNNFWVIFLKRFQQIIIPIIVWACVFRLAILVVHCIQNPNASHIYFPVLSGNILDEITSSFWFLWALFASTIVVSALKSWNLDRALQLFVVVIASLALPEVGNLYLFKYTFPYFCIGYCLSRNSWILRPSKLKLTIGIMLSCICYAIWDKNTYIYISRMDITGDNLHAIAIRYLSGAIVSLTAIIVIWKVYSFKRSEAIVQLGTRSLDIYILQSYAFILLSKINLPLENSILFSLLVAPLIAWILSIACVQLGLFINHIPFASRFLLGRSYVVKNS
jgi:fucose 4-O-acetylase-like acetyltransferase